MIEFRAREDWTANRITLWVTMLEKPNVGASMSFDLSPEIAERLAQDLQTAAKRYRELDKSAQRDLAPKYRDGQRVRYKLNPAYEGTIKSQCPDNAEEVYVQWDRDMHGTVLANKSMLEEII